MCVIRAGGLQLQLTLATLVAFGYRQENPALRAHHSVTVHVAETTLALEVDGETRVFRRSRTKPVRSIKGQAATDRCHSFLDRASRIS